MNSETNHQSARRHFLATGAMGIGSVALAWLLQRDGLLADEIKPDLQKRTFDLKPKPPQQEPQAKAMISLFMQGGPSHMDLTDPKPALTKYHLKTFPGKIKYDNAADASSRVLGSPWKFSHHGECGMELSELLPHTGEIADDITLIRSMQTGVNNHNQSIIALNTGKIQRGRPALGSWLTYGLGAESQDLPAYVALTDPHSLPVEGVSLWRVDWFPRTPASPSKN